MPKRSKGISATVFLILCLLCTKNSSAQKTVIRGFADVTSTLQDNKLGFGLGEQDLFITSELTDRISFLGESVFKYSVSSATSFNVSIERIVIKYNFYGNH